jgi:hypothetical protein
MTNIESWHVRAYCTVCGYHVYAPFGDLFHVRGIKGCCPNCGEHTEEWRMSPQWGRPFILLTMRWVDTGVWWKPSTWGDGYWTVNKGGSMTLSEYQELKPLIKES